MLRRSDPVAPSRSDLLLQSRVPNSYFNDIYLSADFYGRAGSRIGGVKEEPPGGRSQLYPMDVPAGLYGQSQYKGAPLKAWAGEYTLTLLYNVISKVLLITSVIHSISAISKRDNE